MNILYVTQFFYPEITAAAFRAYENVLVWADKVNVTVYTGNPNYPKGTIYEGYDNKWIQKINQTNFNLIRAKSFVKRNTNKFNRIINAVGFLGVGIVHLLFKRKMIGKKFDIILGTSGPIFTAILAYFFAIIYRAKFIFEIRDITYLQMIATMTGKITLSVRIMKFLELFLCKRANKVVVVTSKFKEELIKEGIEEKKIEVIYNGIQIVDNNLEPTVNYTGQLVLTYAGTIGISQELKELIAFFEALQYPNKKLNIIGEGAQREIIEAYIKEKQIKNIEIYNALPPHELSLLMEGTTFGVVKLKYSKYFEGTIPSKIFDLMNRQIPILYLGPRGEASDIITQAQAGITLTTLSNQENARIMMDYLNEHTQEELVYNLKEYGKEGKKYLMKYFNREKLAEQYLQIINDTLITKKVNIDGSADLFTNL